MEAQRRRERESALARSLHQLIDGPGLFMAGRVVMDGLTLHGRTIGTNATDRAPTERK